MAQYANPQYQQRQGGGFTAGAMQTAMGVVGGTPTAVRWQHVSRRGDGATPSARSRSSFRKSSPVDDGGDFFGGDEEF